MSVTPKKYFYQTTIEWQGEKKGLLSCAGKPDLLSASPPEFLGHPDIWSPEDLFVAAVNSCLLMTFTSVSKKQGLTFSAYKAEATGTLEQQNSQFIITEIKIAARILVSQESDIEKAAKPCRSRKELPCRQFDKV